MKRFKLMFLAAAVIGVLSAFTTTSQTERYILIDPATPTFVKESEATELGHCDDGESSCLYTTEEAMPNVHSYQDFTVADAVPSQWVENP